MQFALGILVSHHASHIPAVPNARRDIHQLASVQIHTVSVVLKLGNGFLHALSIAFCSLSGLSGRLLKIVVDLNATLGIFRQCRESMNAAIADIVAFMRGPLIKKRPWRGAKIHLTKGAYGSKVNALA
ncbi:hypothetical protein D3C80_1695060 [compost metagenome]